jgi:spore coat protein U-like protein
MKIIAPVAAGILLAVSGTASALTRTTTFGVSATVAANCTIGATNLAFGTYDASAARTGSSTLSVNCTQGAPYSLALSAGTTAGATHAQRLLANGTNTLQYNLYTTAALGSIWGDGTNGVLVNGVGAGMSSGAAVAHTVFGQVPNSTVNQDAPAGSYTDSITVTITY